MKQTVTLFFILVILLFNLSCIMSGDEGSQSVEETNSTTDSNSEVDHPEGWSIETHSKDVDPNYSIVFNQDEVKRLDITISEQNWQAMLADMADLYGEFGAGAGIDGGDKPLMGRPSDGSIPPMLPQGGDMMGTDENPAWVNCNVQSNDITWWNVGIRFKGNSTLRDSWQSGTYKLPLRLDFDQFEDDSPSIKNQRFYGFKKLSLGSNAKDPSYLRDKLAGDIFAKAGVASAYRSFYRVYIDKGDGVEYFGLYTIAEVPDDPMLDRIFGNHKGNLYKPEGYWDKDEIVDDMSFEKETNEDEGDYSDIQNAINALHDSTKTGEEWRAGLETYLNVDDFLQWIAVNTVMQDWDTYGNMAHNYYLYGDKDNEGKLTWIPWDHNMSLSDTLGMMDPLPIDMSTVTDDWPLIRNIMDDEVYFSTYQEYIKSFNENIFTAENIQASIKKEYNLIEQYVIGENGENEKLTFITSPTDFEAEKNDLLQYVADRHNEVALSY